LVVVLSLKIYEVIHDPQQSKEDTQQRVFFLSRTFKVSFMEWIGCPYMVSIRGDVRAYKCRLCGIEVFADKVKAKEKSEWVKGSF